MPKKSVYNSKAEYDMKYAKENLKRVPLDLPKESYEKVKEHAEKRKESVNGFIKRAIAEAIAHDLEQTDN